MKNPQRSIALGSLFALLGVILGAFGAHALEDTLLQNGTTSSWSTAVSYQMWHAFALIACGILQRGGCILGKAAICFAVGILLFSGSIYWLSLDGPRWLGPITPIGGLSLIIGWALLITAQFRKEKT